MTVETATNIDDLVQTNPNGAVSNVDEVDDHLQLIKKVVKNSFTGADGPIIVRGADTGGDDDYVLTTGRSFTAYTTRMLIVLTVSTAAVSSPTLNIDGIGAKSILMPSGSTPSTSQLKAGTHLLMYDGTNPILLSAPDDTTIISAASTATEAQAILTNAIDGNTVIFAPGTHTYTSGLVVAKALTLQMYGAELDFSSIAASYGIDITANDVKVFGGKLTGPGNSSYSAGSYGIRFVGANNHPSAPTYRTDLIIKHVEIDGWGDAGLYLRYGQRVRILQNKITNIGYSGIGSWAMKDFTYHNNHIDGISPGTSSNSYNIIMSRFIPASSGYTETSEPRCTDGFITENILKDNALWEAIDSKGGDRLHILNNTIQGCKIGMTLAASDDGTGSGDESIAFRNSIVSGNIMYGGLNGVGITLKGAFDTSSVIVHYAENNIIENNFLYNFGINANTNNGAVKLEGSRNTKVRRNHIVLPRYAGILCGLQNKQFEIGGNTIKDPHDSTSTDTSCINIDQNNNTGIIEHNYCIYEDSSLTNPARYSLYAKGSITGVDVVCGRQFYDGIDATHLSFGNMIQAGLDITGAAQESGVADMVITTGTNQITLAVTFRNVFPITPRIFTQIINDQTPGGVLSISTPVSITTSGFTMVINTADGSNYSVAETDKTAWKAETLYLN